MSVAALITTTSSVPSDLGKKVVLNGIVDYLVDRFGREGVHVVLIGPAGTEAPPLPCRTHVLHAPTGREQVAAVAGGLLARRSLQEAALGSRRLAADVARLLGGLGADLEVFDTIRAAQFADRSDGPRRVLHLGDLFSMRYERWLAAIDAGLRSDASPLGEFASMLPAVVRSPIGHWRIYRAALRVERWIVARRERDLAPRFACTTLVSGDEAATLRDRSGGNVVAIPPAVPGPAQLNRVVSGRSRFLFVGHLRVPHNADALVSFLRTRREDVLERCPDFELTVVGRGAGPELRAAAAAWGPAVRLVGFVPDLGPLFDRSCALLAPLRWGSGVKLKVLVALAHGCPVLATSVAAEGIVAPASRHGVVVDDDLSSWPALLAKLTDPAVNRAHARAARQLWRDTWEPAAAFCAYDDAFGVEIVVADARDG